MEGGKCRLNGADLALLAHLATSPGMPIPASFPRPRLAALRGYGLLHSKREGMRWVHVASPIGRLAAAALADRPTLTRELATAHHLGLLCALHALGSRGLAPTRTNLAWLMGASPATFRRAFLALRHTNIVLEPDGRITLNPNLPSLLALLDALEAEAALPPAGLAPAATVHSAGLEAAWRTPVAAHEGLQPIAEGPAFGAIVRPHHIHYRGARKLDSWDHAFMFLLSDAKRHAHATEPQARLKAAVMAMLTPRLAVKPDFVWRAKFYGMGAFAAEAATVLSTKHPFHEFVDEMRTRFGVPEGWLETR